MKDAYMQEMVRKAYIREGKSKRRIAQELGIHRDTVSRLLNAPVGSVPRYQRQEWACPVLEGFKGVIDAWLREDEQAPRKQRHTMKRVHERLQAEYGFEGSYGAVRDYIGKVRRRSREVFLPLAFQPGEMAQVDWIEGVTVFIAGERRKLNIFLLVLNYSGAQYFEAFERTAQEAFFQGHANAFVFLGGVPREITYDNLKTAVQKVLEGKNRLENERFVAFRSAWLFDSRFCQPAKGNEKGRVENMAKFAERNLLTPVPRVESLEELNAHLRERAQAYLEQTQARQQESVGKRLEHERPHLLPLPQHPPQCCRIVSLKADKSALVQFETNRYSVPSEYAYTTVWLKAFVDRVEITNADTVLAVHPRLTGKFQESIRFEHYRKPLERKPGAFQHLRALDKPASLDKEPPKPSQPYRYPQVYVRPPDLSIYRQLWRNPDHDPAPGVTPGNPSQASETAQRAAALSQAGFAGRASQHDA